MGCFDTVFFNCQECGYRIEFQSKSGDCFLRVYDGRNKVPTDVAAGLIGNAPWTCSCGKTYRIEVKKKVRVKLVPMALE